MLYIHIRVSYRERNARLYAGISGDPIGLSDFCKPSLPRAAMVVTEVLLLSTGAVSLGIPSITLANKTCIENLLIQMEGKLFQVAWGSTGRVGVTSYLCTRTLCMSLGDVRTLTINNTLSLSHTHPH